MKEQKIYIMDQATRKLITTYAEIVDAAPAVGDTYKGATVVEVYPTLVDADTYKALPHFSGLVDFETVITDDDCVWYVMIPHQQMSKEEYVQQMMDNDEEGIDYLSEERAAEILRWTRNDDYNDEIPDDLTASEFAARWNEIKRTAMKGISINNGRTYCAPCEAVAALSWDTIINAMDDDTREQVAAEGIDDPVEFLTAYLKAAPCDLIIG